MPELPEVETVCRGLSKALKGQTIEAVTVNRKDLRIPFPRRLPEMAGARVESIGRRAKYILIRLNNDETMIVHLGMSGRMVVKGKAETYRPEKHDHMLLKMRDGTKVVFNDARRFGLVDLVATSALEQHKLLKHLGPEPLEPAFNAEYLAGKFKGKKVAVKLAIMDQTIVVGVGNIYASEALFRAGIGPKRKARTLKKPELDKLVSSIRIVLQEAIKAGGSSLRDYVQADGELGYFQHRWAVYDKAGQKCPGCTCDIKKTGGIKKFTQGARSTFYCPQKQK
jgi:formamidopyrimidine-DNA glycosylase